MTTEIERKFIVTGDGWKRLEGKDIFEIQQAFLVSQPDLSVRVRIMQRAPSYDAPTVKIGFKIGKGPIRTEYEYDMDLVTAQALMVMYPSVSKTRYVAPDPTNSNRRWEIDLFRDNHAGLEIAEIELDSLDEELELPDWVGEEVTWNADYYNCNLATAGCVPGKMRAVDRINPELPEDVEHSWHTFWRDIILDEDGEIDVDQLKRELSDFHYMIDNTTRVFSEVSGHRISKPNTHADAVIGEYNNQLQEHYQFAKDDILELIEGVDDPEEIRRLIKGY